MNVTSTDIDVFYAIDNQSCLDGWENTMGSVSMFKTFPRQFGVIFYLNSTVIRQNEYSQLFIICKNYVALN